MPTNEGRVYFALDGHDFEPNDLTQFLGIEPTSIIRKGSRVPNKLPAINSWSLSTENISQEQIDIFEMARSIIEKIKPKKDLIIAAIKKFNLAPRLEVVITFSSDENLSTPAIGFYEDTIKFLGEIGAFIDIDTYKN